MDKRQLSRLFTKMDKIADPIIKYYKKWDMDIDKGQITLHNPHTFIWAIRETGSEYMTLDFDPYIYKDESKVEAWDIGDIRKCALGKQERIFGVLNNTHFYIVVNGKIDQITKEQASIRVTNFIDALITVSKNIIAKRA